MGRKRKEEFGELTGEAIYSKKAQKELEEREQQARSAEKIELKRAKPGWDPDYFKRVEERRKKLKEGKEAEKGETEAESPEQISEPASEMGALFSPEGVIMMFLAILIDTAGLFCLVLTAVFGIGQIISPVVDIIGMVLIGGWMLFRYGQMTGTKGAKKAGGKLLKRFGLSFLGELIPIFGDVAPCWTLAVYFTLKSK